MFYRHHGEVKLFLVLVAVLLIIASYRPKYHLRTDMPIGFFSPAASESGQKRSLDKRIAWAYWESAQMNVQWKYPYSHPLPPDPIPEFSVSAQALGQGASDPATRLLYWRKLQEIWFEPETWKKDYEWDLSWISDPLTAASDWISNRWASWFSIHGPR